MTYLDFTPDDFGNVTSDPDPAFGFVDAGFDGDDPMIDAALDIILPRRTL